jgi:putative DNA methylase
MGVNALASSIVLVCRKRRVDAETVERETFVRALRRELPSALVQIRAAGIGPVDMAQSAIGPGMGVFTRYAAVLEDSGQKMTVRTALALINQIRDELDQDDDAAYDLPTRFALDWFEDAGWDARDSGDAILAANARNLGLDKLVRIGLIVTQSGKTRLTRRDEMPPRGAGASRPPTIWQAAQRLAGALVAQDGGQDRAAAVMTRLADRESVRALAYRLYGVCERKGWAAEALVWNHLAEDWRHIAERAEAAAPSTTRDLFEMHA